MDQAPLEAGCHQLAVFGSVAHIKGNLGPIAGSALPKRAGDNVRTSGHFGTGNDPVTVDQGWRILWHDRLERVENVAEILAGTISSHLRTGRLWRKHGKESGRKKVCE